MTYTHLTIGQSKIPAKPPRAQPPCTEPIKYGSNVLRDPGFELHVSNTGGGPGGDEVSSVRYSDDGTGSPLEGDDGFLHWSDGSTVDASLPGWFAPVAVATGDDTYYIYPLGWRADTTAPRTGTYHLRSGPAVDGQSVRANDVIHLAVLGVVACLPDAGGGIAEHPYYAARVGSGDFVELSFYAKAVLPGSTSALIDDIELEFYEADGTWIGGSYYSNAGNYAATKDMTTSYVQWTFATFAPATSHFVYANIIFQQTPDAGQNTYIDVDDCVLKVSK